jgi:hypothetical protein
MRTPIERPGRLSLPPPALAHMWPSASVQERVYIVRFGARLELWSASFRNARRSRQTFEGLP